MTSSFRINNFKVSVVAFNKLSIHQLSLVNVNNNFIVLDISPWKYIIFPSNKYGEFNYFINITGIRRESDIDKAVIGLQNCFNFRVKKDSLKIDNISANGQFKNRCNLTKLYYSEKPEQVKLSYHSNVFPGLYYKTPRGTASIFSSGKFCIIGCKSIDEVKTVFDQVHSWVMNQE